MRVALHAGLRAGGLLVWAEEARSQTPAKAQARPARGVPPAYGLAGDRLAEVVGGACPDLGFEAFRPGDAIAWLPTGCDGLPLPCDEAFGDAPVGPVGLAPWRVEGIDVPVGPAMRLFAACAGRERLTPGLWLGPDVRYWAEALRRMAWLARGGLLLPGLRSVDGTWRATWEPVLSGRAGRALTQLATSMPAACRALGGDAAAAPAPAAASVLTTFLGLVADHLPRAPAAVAPVGPSGHDQWLAALCGPDGALEVSEREGNAVRDAARTWAAPLQAVAGDYRLCFRLEEPHEDAAAAEVAGSADGAGAPSTAGAWRVRYLLQANDDPSLLLEASRIWRPRRGEPAPREALLSGLGRAAALCAEVAESLHAQAPEGFELDAAGAHGFLERTAWVLEEAGFGVLLPSWWTGSRDRHRLTLHATARPMAAAAGLGVAAVVNFDWEVALGQEVLTRQELEALARLKAPLVRLRGRWVQVSAQEIRAALAAQAGRLAQRGTLAQVLRLSAGAEAGADLAGLPVAAVRAEGWIREAVDRLSDPGSSGGAPPGVPEGLRATLRPYQYRGYTWLHRLAAWGMGACLADDMGLGKTVQTLALLQQDRQEGAEAPSLLVCPTSLVGNWLREAARFAPDLAVMAHHGPGRLRAEAFATAGRRQALVITTYPLVPRDLADIAAVRWRGVILDEAQNVKNAGTHQARAVRSLACDWRVALTGTPVENSVGDLWALMDFLNPGLLGGQAEFRRTFFMPIQGAGDPEATARLRRLTGPFVLRRLKTDPDVAPDLPAKMEAPVYCTLTAEQATLYRAVVADLEAGMQNLEGEGGIERRGLILAALSKLKQVCNHPAHLLRDRSELHGRSGKLDRLSEMLEEVVATPTDAALVFTQFAEMGRLLQRHLEETLGMEVSFLHGGVPRLQRERLVERFQRPQGPRVLVLSLKAGGTGLNLTRANFVFHFDRWWNPAVEDQATDRAYRIGQTRAVQVRKLVCAGTLEERIDAMIDRKRAVAQQVIGAGEGWITELDAAELRALVSLSPDAVGG